MLPVGARSLWKERIVVLGVIGALVAACWAYLVTLTVSMNDMGSALSMPMGTTWGARDWCYMVVMWVVMMIGMMLPSASPMILAYRGFNAGRRSTPAFVGGYVFAWSAFSVVATVLQWWLHDIGVLNVQGVATSGALAASLLVLAGAFQFTPLKHACLTKCRSPLAFLMTEWRPGARGALVMGVRHGSSCIGCCWAMMLLLFAFGVMNLAWVAILAGFMLVEKAFPAAQVTTRLAGAGAMAWGIVMLLTIALH